MALFNIYETENMLDLASGNFSFDTFVSSTATVYVFNSVDGRTIV